MKYKKLFLVAIISLMLVQIAFAESSTRTVPSTVSAGSTFTVTYTAIGFGSGRWGLIIDDTVSGGCSFPSGTSYQDVLLSDSGTTRSVQVTAPSSGICTFRGNYMYDAGVGEVDYPTQTVTIADGGCQTDWDCGAWSECNDDTKKQTRTCIDRAGCVSSKTETKSCGGTQVFLWVIAALVFVVIAGAGKRSFS